MPGNSPMSRKAWRAWCSSSWKWTNLHTALSLLTPEERALIQALFFDERKESELAVELGISQPAVYKRKMKILKKLKIFLEK